ncbi:MAG: ABC-F family ATP-binding cassette domain-containing protein [Treponema sp.]|uniref:ABC-F family ATP-binding cassette domain-containing protein n=1 Tax=Treponema sp. TaxID=166 RepID=UPI00298E6746|nr:ABC-F family ATP-binding cassette domain-containing protein [Treponema sp.]MBR5934079.1 ABC-F family ATP-binding cassette domain-containing protein [Treponema sp.]
MAFVQFSKVSLAFGDRDILKDVSVNMASGTKAALTGANGAGKSTLIKIMAGITEPDSGERIVQKDTRIAYLPQSGLTHHGTTLLQEADKAFQFGYDIQKECDDIGEQLKNNPDNSDYLIERQSMLLSKLEESGWYRRQAQAESVLLGLGFMREDFNRSVEEFSGGWQMRIALAKTLMQSPDILLLDEPTNYLDIEARNWLESFLKNFKGGFLLVSHDRYFLDVTINEVFELFGGNLKSYPGNFTHYEKVREVELASLMAEYDKQQLEIAHLQDFIRRFGYKATKAAQAQERQKMLDKILENKIEIPESLKKIHFKFPPAPHSGNIVLRMHDITKSYDGKNSVLDKLELLLEKGERLVVAGHNGAGKSTLLRIIAGVDKDFTGTVENGSGVSIGYFSQDSAETISSKQSVIDYIEGIAPLELIPKVRDMLAAFLFRGDDVNKTLDVLSGGEKTRIALLQLLLKPVNLLVLDEPTNHLDMHSKDVLLSALKDFGGTVVFVSHDRGFIQDLATRVLELRPGKFRNFKGDYEYYMQRLADEEAGITGQPEIPEVTPEPAVSAGALSWEEEKRLQAEKRKKEKEVSRLEGEIAGVEAKITELQNKLSDPAVYSVGEKARAVQTEISDLQVQLEKLNEEWEQAALAL